MERSNLSKEVATFMKENLFTIWIPNALANGIVYYFMNRHIEKSAFDFWIGGTITAFVLALICGACAIVTVEKKLREGKIHAESYTRHNNIIGRFMPEKSVQQLLFTALLVTIVFTFVSGILSLILGHLSKPIPIKSGTLLHSIQCGFMGVLTVYFTLIGRCVKHTDVISEAVNEGENASSEEGASLDTMLLYSMGKNNMVTIRISVEMIEAVDGELLKIAVNEAIKRYPYFKKRLALSKNGEYLLLDSDLSVVVTKAANSPTLGSESANGYLISVDYDDRSIGFNISHTLTNGPGVMEWVLTTLYQYVTKVKGISLNCPTIRKVDSPFLNGECNSILEEMLPKDNVPIWRGYSEKKIKTFTILMGYIRCMLQFKNVNNYYTVSIDEEELIHHIKENDGSPATFFSVVMFRAADKWMPAKYKDIEIGNYVCTARLLGIPNSYMDSSMVISTRYKRDMIKWSTEKLCTMTRGNFFLQSDESVAIQYWQDKLSAWMQMKKAKGLKAKQKICMVSGKSHTFATLPMTASISYIGRYDLGELSAFVKTISPIVDGEGMMEIIAMNHKFYVTFLQKDRKERWFKSFLSVLDDENINYTVEGPFEKNLSKGVFPATRIH